MLFGKLCKAPSGACLLGSLAVCSLACDSDHAGLPASTALSCPALPGCVQELLPVALQLHTLYQPAPLLPTHAARLTHHAWAQLMATLVLTGGWVAGWVAGWLRGRAGARAGGRMGLTDWHFTLHAEVMQLFLTAAAARCSLVACSEAVLRPGCARGAQPGGAAAAARLA